MTTFKSKYETNSARSIKPEAIDNLHDYKYLKLKILCVGDYAGASSKGVYIKDYVSELVNEGNYEKLEKGFHSYSKTLRNTSGHEIRLSILNIGEQERIRWGETCIHNVYRHASGAVVFEGAENFPMGNAEQWAQQISQVEHKIPFVLLVDNVIQPPAKRIGQGLQMNFKEGMDDFCLKHGFFAWFDMCERVVEENSVCGQAMATLVDEIISRNNTKIPEPCATTRKSKCVVA